MPDLYLPGFILAALVLTIGLGLVAFSRRR